MKNTWIVAASLLLSPSPGAAADPTPRDVALKALADAGSARDSNAAERAVRDYLLAVDAGVGRAFAAAVGLPDRPAREVPAALYPSGGAAKGAAGGVVFGLPLPPGALSDLSQVRLLDASGAEVPIAVQGIVPWRSIADPSTAPKTVTSDDWRAVLVHADLRFADASP